MDYIHGICFENTLVNTDETKSLTNINQLGNHKVKIGAGVAPSITYGLPARVYLWGLVWGRIEYWT